MELAVLLDLARFLAGVAILTCASVTDWYWRRAPNVLWYILGGLAVTLLLAQYIFGLFPQDGELYVMVAVAFAVGIYLFYRIGLIAGGADAKALMALALLVPFPLDFGALPLRRGIVPTPFAVLGDALVGILVIPLALVVLNVVRGNLSLPVGLIGYKVRLDTVLDRPVWLIDRIEDGRHTRRYMRPMDDAEEQVPLLREARVDPVWVTPKIPFMIPLLIGFLLAFTAGDVLFSPIVSLILGR